MNNLSIKEEAEQLANKFFKGSVFDYPDNTLFKLAKKDAIRCAIIHIDLTIKRLKNDNQNDFSEIKRLIEIKNYLKQM